MKKIRENSNMTVMNVDLVEKRKNEIIQIESAETHEGCKPLFLVEYGGNTEAELRSQFYEEFQEGFQKDEIELMGRKCSEWNSIFHEWAQIELYQKEQAELSNSVNELTNLKTELESKVAELEKQIEKMKCCGNCKHCYEGKVEQGGRCKDHYSDSVCENYESDEMTTDERLHNE